MNRKLCVLSWALFGISIACLTAVAPYALEWAEPVAAFHAGICSLLLIYSAAASLFSALGMAIPGGRKLLFFAIISSMMLFACLISGMVSIPFTACAIILAAALAFIVDFIAESQSFSENPIPEIASAILILLFAATIVAIFCLVELPFEEEYTVKETIFIEPVTDSSEVSSDEITIEDDSSAVTEPSDIYTDDFPEDYPESAETDSPDAGFTESPDTEQEIAEAEEAIPEPAEEIVSEPVEIPEEIIETEPEAIRVPSEPFVLEPVISELSLEDEPSVPQPPVIIDPVITEIDTSSDGLIIIPPVLISGRTGSEALDTDDIQNNDTVPAEGKTGAISLYDYTGDGQDNVSLSADTYGVSVTGLSSDAEILADDAGTMTETQSTENYLSADNGAEGMSVETSSADSFFDNLSPDEAAFWSDFYIEGEDELVLEDGFYYMDFYVNGTYVGAIETEIISGSPYISSPSLRSYLASSITIDAQDRIFVNQESYLSLDYLESVGVQTSFDAMQYRIDLVFSTVDMPIQILSIRQSSPRVQTRPISGAVNLNPAVFTLASEYTFSFTVPDFLDPEFWNDFRYSFDVSNRARLYNVYLDFSYYLDWTHHSFDFTMGSYRFYVDFPDQMIRLAWGNVSTSLLSPEGTDFGIRFDKSLSYADSSYSRGNNYEQVIEVPVRSDVIIYNNGDGRAENQIFRRTLDPGVYMLRDFILYSGANRILIRIEPLDGSPAREFVMDVQYSASLLQPGEIYYGASLTTGRIWSRRDDPKSDMVVSIPLGDERVDYDWRNLTLEGYVRAGLTNSLTGDFSLAVQNLPNDISGLRFNAQAAVELTHENILGTTRYNLNLYEYADDYGNLTTPYFRFRIGHQANTGFRPVSSVTFSIGYDSPRDFTLGTNHDVSLDVGVSGSYGIFSWSASGSLSTDVTDMTDLTWSALLSTSFYFKGNISMNASFNISGYADGTAPTVGGRIGFTFRFGRNTVYATASESYATLDYDYYDDRNSFSASVDTSSYTNTSGLGFGADYTYNGDIFKVSADLSMRGLAESLRSSVRISTSSIFADGYLAFASSIPDNWIIVRQAGSLSRNRLSIGASNTSSATSVPTAFGSGLYSGISSPSSLMIFSEGDSVFSPVYSEAVNLVESRQKGYVYTIDREDTYAVSGIVELPDGTLWINGASPVYAAEITEDGNISLTSTDKYIFTDSNGYFIMSDLSSGLWAFDVSGDEGWHLYVFEAGEEGASPSVVKVFLQTEQTTLDAGDVYADVYEFTDFRYMDDEAFFSMLYPMEAV